MTNHPRKRLLLALLLFACVAGVSVGESLRVVSINAWSGLTYRGVLSVGEYEEAAARDFRFELLTRNLAQLAPDVVGLNEANPLPQFARTIGESLQYAFVYRVRMGGVRLGPVGLPVNLREGDLILAREQLNLVDGGNETLTGGPAGNLASFQFGEASQVVASSISIAGTTVHVFVTHWHGSEFASRDNLTALAEAYAQGEVTGVEYADAVREAVRGKERRLEQARETLVFVNKVAGHDPAILMGTFNALPESEEIGLLTEAGFRDVWATAGRGPGYTWDPATNSNILEYGPDLERVGRRRIDYVFVRGDAIRVDGAAVVMDTPTFGIHPSDHYGVLADLTVASGE